MSKCEIIQNKIKQNRSNTKQNDTLYRLLCKEVINKIRDYVYEI